MEIIQNHIKSHKTKSYENHIKSNENHKNHIKTHTKSYENHIRLRFGRGQYYEDVHIQAPGSVAFLSPVHPGLRSMRVQDHVSLASCEPHKTAQNRTKLNISCKKQYKK